MASLVPASDLGREVGPLDATETSRALGFLEEASDLAREIGLSTWTEVGGANPAPASVRGIVKRAARRALVEDTEGFTSETLGDWTGRKPTTDLDESGVFYTASEERKIARAAGKAAGVFSVRTPAAFESTSGPTIYAPVVGGESIAFLVNEDV